MSNDIVRFMDEHKITMATIGGHGFGAKVATATAINNVNRFTGVMCIEGGPLDHTYYEAYQELASYIEAAHKLNIGALTPNDAVKRIYELIPDAKWRHLFV
jgi:pimeloyl-ACP methyl ester carboxylesterase